MMRRIAAPNDSIICELLKLANRTEMDKFQNVSYVLGVARVHICITTHKSLN